MPHEHRPDYLEPLVYQRLRHARVEPPTRKQITRLIASATYRHQQSFFRSTAAALPEAVKVKLRHLIYPSETSTPETDLDVLEHYYALHELKVSNGDAKVTANKHVAARLKQLQELGLPQTYFMTFLCVSCASIGNKPR